ncbi:hypothetical protein [Cystobacter fuscus]|uniref:hypothetical protein n=1 Tax=Cystobacter fuscus TaxID=43 RepID=UPI0037BE8585
MPPGWPDFSSDDGAALLAPFLTCASPAEFLALQDRVDMPRLVERLDDWGAVRLGSLGTPREGVAHILNRKRTSFLVKAIEAYGVLRAEGLALFIVDSAHDDDLREILFVLARDKRIEETLELLPAFRAALEKRGLKPTARPDRDFEWGDLGRGLARAGRDALSSTQVYDGGAGFNFTVIRNQLPPLYQEALDTAENQWMEQHYAPGNVVLGVFDHLTFGVPLGFHGLVTGTGHGVYSLTRGQYERATRELAPAVLLVTLYAGGKGVRALSDARGATTGAGAPFLNGPQALESRWRGFKERARQLEMLLGVDGLRELSRDIQASREAGRFVAVGGVDAALALREARGDVARAQAWLSEARSEHSGAPVARGGAAKSPGERLTSKDAHAAARPGSLASLVDEHAGLTSEVVGAKLAWAESESPGPRLPRDVAVLEKQRPSLESPPIEALGNPRWPEYVAYFERRLGELKQGMAVEGPLRWAPYEKMWHGFARGLAFERAMLKLLYADAELPRAQRRFLGDFDKPRIERYVGVRKPGPGLRFVDVLVIEESEFAGRPPRVETFSFKSRNLALLEEDALTAQMSADAREALGYYGETLDIRRLSLKHLLPEGSRVLVPRVRLIYEDGGLKPKRVDMLKRAVRTAEQKAPGVEVYFQ